MDHDDHLPHAHVVTEAGPLPPAAVVTGCIESGDRRCQNDAILVIETARRLPETTCIMPFILTAGVLLLLVALVQALLASNVKKKGIKVLDSWAFGSYPTAGDPSIGFAGLSIGALFVFISLLAIFADGTQRCIPVAAAICAVLSSLGLFVKSFGELAVYNALDINEHCMVNIESEFTPRGDCVCWVGDINSGDLISEIRSESRHVEYVNVDIASNAGMSCDRILFHLDDIRTSYLLTAVSVGVLMITAIVLLVRLQREGNHAGVQATTP